MNTVEFSNKELRLRVGPKVNKENRKHLAMEIKKSMGLVSSAESKDIISALEATIKDQIREYNKLAEIAKAKKWMER